MGMFGGHGVDHHRCGVAGDLAAEFATDVAFDLDRLPTVRPEPPYALDQHLVDGVTAEVRFVGAWAGERVERGYGLPVTLLVAMVERRCRIADHKAGPLGARVAVVIGPWALRGVVSLRAFAVGPVGCAGLAGSALSSLLLGPSGFVVRPHVLSLSGG